MSGETNMIEIVQFAEFLLNIVKEEEKRGNKNAKLIIENYRQVINDGIWQYENVVNLFDRNDSDEDEDLKLLKRAQRILK